MRTLYLSWQGRENRLWFPIGRLDEIVKNNRTTYVFRYIKGAKNAQSQGKFLPLPEFPILSKFYVSTELFPIFSNRVMSRSRPDRHAYLTNLNLEEKADPVDILSVNGGRRVTDAFEVFPRIKKDRCGRFTCQFFLHGWRYVDKSAQVKIDTLASESRLQIIPEKNNSVDDFALGIHTQDNYKIGWTPRYLSKGFIQAMEESPEIEVKVVRINPLPAPSSQRVLIEMSGYLGDSDPMDSEEFTPLVEYQV